MLEASGEGAFDYQLSNVSSTRIQWHFFERTHLPVAVQTWELPPDGAEAMHVHPDSEPLEEIYLVIDGQATMRVDGQTYHLRSGDSVLARVSAEHDLRNTGDGPLKVVVVWGEPTAGYYAPFDIAAAAKSARAD